MLGKLIKHEWKSTWKIPSLFSLFLLIVTLLGCLSFRMPFWQRLVKNESAPSIGFSDMMGFLILMIFIIGVFVYAYAPMVYFSFRFYKNLFTDDGYLMHTLPVTPGQLIISKWLIFAFWTLVSSLLVLLTTFSLIYSFIMALTGEVDRQLFMELFKQALPEINNAFKEYAGIGVGGLCLVFALIMIVGSFSSVGLIYLCFSIGQMFRKHKVAASIITYLVVSTVIQTATSILLLPYSLRLTLSIEEIAYATPIDAMVRPLASTIPIYYITGLLSLIFAVISFFVARYLIKEKLNLD